MDKRIRTYEKKPDGKMEVIADEIITIPDPPPTKMDMLLLHLIDKGVLTEQEVGDIKLDAL